MGLNLNHVSVLLVEFDDRRILRNRADDVRRLDVKNSLLQDGLARLITTMLAPTLGERLKLDISRITLLTLKVVAHHPQLRQRKTEHAVSADSIKLFVFRLKNIHVINVNILPLLIKLTHLKTLRENNPYTRTLKICVIITKNKNNIIIIAQ